MKYIKKEHSLLFGLIILLIVVCFAFFLVGNQKRIIENNKSYIQETAVQTAKSIDRDLMQAENLIRDMALVYSAQSFQEDSQKMELLKELSENSSFNYLELISKEGIDVSTAGGTADVSDRDYFKAAMKGKSGIEVVKHSKITNETLIIFYSPIKTNGEVSEILCGVYTEEHMRKLMNGQAYGKKLEACIVDTKGKMLFGTDEKEYLNLFDKLAVKTKNYSSASGDLKKYIANRQNVSFELKLKDGVTAGAVVPLGTEEWVLFEAMPAAITRSMLNTASRSGIILILQLLAAFIILVRLLMLMGKRRKQQLQLDKDRVEAILSTIPALLIEEKSGTGLVTFLGNSEGVFDVQPGTTGRKELIKNLVYKEDWRKFQQLYVNLKNGETRTSVELRMRDRTGDYIWAEMVLFSISDKQGQQQEILGIVYNIDKQIRRNKEHSQIIDSFSKLYQTIRLVDLNRDSYEYLKGYRSPTQQKKGAYSELCSIFAEQYAAREAGDYVRKRMDPEYLREHISPETPFLEFEFQLQQSPQRWNRAYIILVAMEAGKASQVLFAIRDISKYKQENLSRTSQLKEAFESTSHVNEAKSRFIAKLSRQLRVPLNVILGMSGIASEHLEDKEKIADCLKKIYLSGHQLQSIIGAALDVSKIENRAVHLTEAPFYLHSMLHDVEQEAQTMAAKKGHTLRIDFTEITHDYVLGDEIRLKQVFLNLISNAVEYTMRKGNIEVVMRESVSSYEERACYVITVKDNGIGMTEEFCQKIFEPFIRAQDIRTRNADGAGLGLVAVKNIVMGMKGSVTIDSKPNQGTLVTAEVHLKLQPTAREFTERDKEYLKGQKVLLAEDDPMNQEVITELLHQIGLQADVCFGGAEVIKKLNSANKKEYAFVLLDTHMPGMGGYETTVRIRSLQQENTKEIPIITMMESDTPEEIYKARLAGINDYLMKPVDRDGLEQIIRRWILK